MLLEIFLWNQESTIGLLLHKRFTLCLSHWYLVSIILYEFMKGELLSLEDLRSLYLLVVKSYLIFTLLVPVKVFNFLISLILFGETSDFLHL